MNKRSLFVATASAAVATVALSSTAALGARAVTIGLQDDRMAQFNVDPSPRMALVKDLNARLVRVDMRWDLIAPTRPAAPRSPADPAYNWSHYDAVVAAARARRVNVMFTVWGTPGWAADPKVPASPPLPTFGRRPKNPQDAGDFAAAAAARYGPRGVKMWEAWNEPNIPIFMQPQFRRVGGRWVPESPRYYSRLLKAMYRGFKASDRKARVAGGVTAPVGELDYQRSTCQPNCRIQPRHFVTALGARGLRPPMDVVSHHPYPLRKPSNTNFPGASYTDLYNLSYFERDLDRTYLRGKALWLTEFGVATKRVTQYPFFRTEAQQVEGLRDAIRRVRANPRVKVFVWYLLQDHDEWASGLLRQNGSRKPSAAVFRTLAR